MKTFLFILSLLCSIHIILANGQHDNGMDVEDNEFAEFEDFDDGSETKKDEKSNVDDAKEFESEDKSDEDEEAVVETEEDEFDTLDPEEFEGLPGDDSIWENGNEKIKSRKSKKGSEPELKIANVPIHSRSWDKYYLEILTSAALAVYLVNFFLGKTKNNKIAGTCKRSCFDSHPSYVVASLMRRFTTTVYLLDSNEQQIEFERRLKENLEFLSSQFELVGDDPSTKPVESTNQLEKLSEHTYSLWCSGRQCCEGMLVELKLLKRQDLISIISSRVKPVSDQVTITVTMSDMDSYVFCVGTKKAIGNLHKTMQDVNSFCTEKSRPGDKLGLNPNLVVLSEMYGDLTNAILNDKVVKVLNESEEIFESLHITDQFCGLVPSDQDEPVTKQPTTEKQITLTLNLPKSRRDARNNEQVSSLLKLVVFLIDKIRKYRLSRENKVKADKHRQEVTAKFLKLTHAQRQEAAQLKKEEKERALKERMMNEEDPDKQRRMDEMIHRRELNKKNKKMMKSRQFKVKAM